MGYRTHLGMLWTKDYIVAPFDDVVATLNGSKMKPRLMDVEGDDISFHSEVPCTRGYGRTSQVEAAPCGERDAAFASCSVASSRDWA